MCVCASVCVHECKVVNATLSQRCYNVILVVVANQIKAVQSSIS